MGIPGRRPAGSERQLAPTKILFTDLDGTLLDHHTYQPEAAGEALLDLLAAGVSVFFCSAKTLAEQEALADQLEVDVGFIGENGGIVKQARAEEPHLLGVDFDSLKATLSRIRTELNIEVNGYWDLSPVEVAAVTGLDLVAAGLARERECTETLVDLEDEDVEPLASALARHGLRLSRGARFWTVQGEHDKGGAIRHVLGSRPAFKSFGVGDSHNDLELLRAVDEPMLVRGHDGAWAPLEVTGLTRLDGVGPEGWVLAAESVLAFPE